MVDDVGYRHYTKQSQSIQRLVKIHFTAVCKNVQKWQSAQHIKEHMRGKLSAAYEHLQREK